MPGFSLKILEQKLPADSKFLCECCGSLLQRAKKASCGHFFCSSCVENLLCKNPGRVSICLRSMKQLFHIDTEFLEADAAFCDELQNLQVQCESCSWRGKLLNFEHHIGTCVFYSYHEKQLEQIEASDQNHCSQTENKSNQLGDIHELQNSNAASYVACQQHLLETCDFTSNCAKEKEQTEDNQQNHCSQEIEVNSNQVDDNHESVLRPKAACNNVLYYTEECGSFDTRGKDGNQGGMKEKLSNTALPSSLKVLPGYSAVDAKEQIAPLVKDMTSGNANARNASSYCSPEDSRMINLEKKVEFLLVENQRLNQEVSKLKNGRFDDKRNIEYIEQTLSQSLCRQNSFAENLCRAVDALKYEHATLKDRIDRFLENPFSREEHVMLIRHMEAMQGQIVHIDQHVMSHGNMINDLSTSLTSLANIVANNRVPGVDIQPLE